MKQQQFASKDPVGKETILFTNILDKGYRCTVLMYRHGAQRVLQPIFKIKDKQRTDEEVLTTASIASDRSGNERAVKLMKTAGIIKSGIESNQSFKTVNDYWHVYGFQVNFMYKSVM